MPDASGTNPDEPQPRKVAQNVAAGAIVKDCADCPEMVVIPGDSFVMGSEKNPEEKPLHRVHIRSFLIGRTEVTREEWTAVMGAAPTHFGKCEKQCPVERVSWLEVQTFIQKINVRTGMTYRLPSESEWEYVARSGTKTEWSFGDSELALNEYGWYDHNSARSSHGVGQKKPNTFKVFDMQGNLWEWVSDCWHENYIGAPMNSTSWDSNCASEQRVLRGGSYLDYPNSLRSAKRRFSIPSFQASAVGFRLARDL
jgi:formylglycine-generating enzyme required for sulfatase activity